MKMETPKPCPFCGGREIREDLDESIISAMECYGCGANGPPVNSCEKQDIVGAWNRRVDVE